MIDNDERARLRVVINRTSRVLGATLSDDGFVLVQPQATYMPLVCCHHRIVKQP